MAAADKTKYVDCAGSNDKDNKNVNHQQKRKSDVAFDDPLDATDGVKRVVKEDNGHSKSNKSGEDTKTASFSIKKPMGISMNIGGPKKAVPIKISMQAQKQDKKETTTVLPKSSKVASVFNEDSESDEEEMPPEAKMRMRNVGRETPTASGPNSFGKGNLGFCDRTKMIERQLLRQMEAHGEKSDKT